MDERSLVKLLIVPVNVGHAVEEVEHALNILLHGQRVHRRQVAELEGIGILYLLGAHDEPTDIVLALIQREHLTVNAGQAVSGHHRGADAGFDGEDHVAFQFDVLADALAPQAVEPEDILVVRGLADDLGDEGSRAE